MECLDCHRTGFTEDELRVHVGGEHCVPLPPSELRAHLKFDFASPDEAATHVRETGAIVDADAIVQDLRAELDALKAKVAEITSKPAAPAGAPSKGA